MSGSVQIEQVVTGDVIRTAFADNIMGHGTVLAKVNNKDQHVASVTGVVDRVNKLISVRPFCKRYTAEVGDVVVGRITDVVDKKWKLDLNARQKGILMLSSVNLPGGQRRRTDEDSLQMRAFLTETDLISAEVQKVQYDGCASVHTRSAKYGKLEYGTLVAVSASFIRRTKQHFHTLPDLGVDVIIGVNGFVWVSPTPSEEERLRKLKEVEDDSLIEKEGGGTSTTITGPKQIDTSYVSDEVRESIARIRNSIGLLNKARKQIYKESILYVYNESVTLNLPCSEMFHPEHFLLLTQHANLN